LRNFEALERYQQEPVLIISGDVHRAELGEIRASDPDWPLVELTFSEKIEEWSAISLARRRIGEAFAQANYGSIDIDWRTGLPVVQLRIKNVQRVELLSHRLDFQSGYCE